MSMTAKNIKFPDNVPIEEFVYDEGYPFPVITHIDQVRSAVGHLPEFAFRERDGFIFCSYKRVCSDTFPLVPKSKLFNPQHELSQFTEDPQSDNHQEMKMKALEQQQKQLFNHYLFRREVRGLAFDGETGKIAGRQLHKFFNIDERLDSSANVVQQMIHHSIRQGHSIYIMEKLDGSLVSPIFTKERKMRLRTKMGFNNDTSNACENMLYGSNHVDQWPSVDEILERYEHSEIEYERILHFCAFWMLKGYNPLFEFYTNETMIVIQYDKSFFTLIAMRHIETGHYVSYTEMVNHANKANISVVPVTSIDMTQDTTSHTVIQYVKKMDGKEGCVIRFNDGQMFKVKSEWYSDLHRLKQHLVYNAVNEGNVWALVFDERVDDSLPMLSEHERKALGSFNDDLWRAVNETAERALTFCTTRSHLNKKEFADEVKKETRNAMWAKTLYLVSRASDSSDAETHVISVVRLLLFKDLDNARTLLQAPHLLFFKNYLTSSVTTDRVDKDD